MKPIAFRIRDFRSIVDSGICPLSGDGITVLAGQNESGKTAVLSALRDFDLPVGDPPQTSDYMPEGRLAAVPTVSVQFSVEMAALQKALAEEQLILPTPAIEAINASKTIWLSRDLNSGQYRLDDDLAAAWADVPAAPESEDGDDDNEEDDESAAGGETTEPRLIALEEVGDNLRQVWPHFIYFDSFQDSLPREVPLSTLIVSPKANAGRSVAINKEAPQAVQDFIALS